MTCETEQHEPWEDPIVAEVRAAREAIFAQAGYDLGELCRQLNKRARARGETPITLPPRRVETAGGGE